MNSRHTLSTIVELESMKTQVFMSDRLSQLKNENCPPRNPQAMSLKGTSVLLLFVLLGSGCAHYPVNHPLAAVDGRTGYRFENTAFSTNSDDLLLMLAFSGGGTRAAALDYGVLEELARTGVGPPSEQHRLLDEVDLISTSDCAARLIMP